LSFKLNMKTKKFLSGLALGALIGSALGLFFNPETGQKNRTKFKKITKLLSEKLITDVSKAGKIGKKEYDAIVANIIKKYSKNDLLSPAAWDEIKKELMLRWQDIQAEIKKNGKKKK